MPLGFPETSSQPAARLDTWKSIAQHMARSMRTVQRWHSTYGLPVHHLSGESGSVYAYADDLDNWLKSRGRPQAAEIADSSATAESLHTTSHVASRNSNVMRGLSQVSVQAEVRSAHLVSLATKLWETVSNRSILEILELYRAAVDLNPRNAAAYAGLSLALSAQGVGGLVSPPFAYASAQAAYENANEIDPELPLVKCARAWLRTCSTRDWRGAHRDFDQILQDAGSRVRSLIGRGLLFIGEGRVREASELFHDAAQRNPLSSCAITLHCWSEFLAGEFAYALHRIDEIRATLPTEPFLDAVEALCILQGGYHEARMDRVEALAVGFPKYDVLQGVLGYAYALRGQVRKAREILEPMMNQARGRISHEPYAMALILVGLKENREAVSCLEQSYRNGSLWSLGFQSDPVLESLRNDPYSRYFLRKVGYPESANTGAHLRDAG